MMFGHQDDEAAKMLDDLKERFWIARFDLRQDLRDVAHGSGPHD